MRCCRSTSPSAPLLRTSARSRSHDRGQDGGPEPAARNNDGLCILLLAAQENAVAASVENERAGCHFELTVERERALDAYHPFAYPA